jgi:hypothetical protein
MKSQFHFLIFKPMATSQMLLQWFKQITCSKLVLLDKVPPSEEMKWVINKNIIGWEPYLLNIHHIKIL